MGFYYFNAGCSFLMIFGPREEEMKDFKVENLGTPKDSQYLVAETTLIKLIILHREENFRSDSANLNAVL